MKRTKLFFLLAALLLFSQSCNTTRVSRRPHRVLVTYNDNVTDTLETRYWYKTGRTVYVHECSCDGRITYLKN